MARYTIVRYGLTPFFFASLPPPPILHRTRAFPFHSPVLIKMHYLKHRAASLALSIVSALTNLVVAAHVLSLWRVLRWESESEWEGSADGWRVDSIKLVWLLLAAYFSTATVICLIGAFGVIKVCVAALQSQLDYSLFTTSPTARPFFRAPLPRLLAGGHLLLRPADNCHRRRFIPAWRARDRV